LLRAVGHGTFVAMKTEMTGRAAEQTRATAQPQPPAEPFAAPADATALASAAAKLQARASGARTSGRRRAPTLFLLTDDARLADPVAAAARLPRGAAVIARARDADALGRLVAALVPICRRRHVALIVANDPRLALRHRAGVHLSEVRCRSRGLAALGLPRGRRRQRLLVAAAHSLPALLRAGRLGAAAVLLSPVFATASHPGARPLGAIRFAAAIRAARRKGLRAAVIALGGVTADTARQAMMAGADGLAAIGALAGRDSTRRGDAP
jgi:thiamine-phosphate pyrophosphorylase